MNKKSITKISLDEYDEYPEVTQADIDRAVLRKNFEPADKLPLPKEFIDVDEAVKYWETHSLKNYLDGKEDIDLETLEKSRKKWIPLATSLFDKIASLAKKEGVSVETLVNLWISERLEVGIG